MMRWTAEMLDVTPHWCLRCERKVRDISVSRWKSQGWYLIRCSACGFILTKIPIIQTEPAKIGGLLAPPRTEDDSGDYQET